MSHFCLPVLSLRILKFANEKARSFFFGGVYFIILFVVVATSVLKHNLINHLSSEPLSHVVA